MTVVGTWDVTINTPFGAQVVAIWFTDEHTGVATFRGESVPLQNVAVSGTTGTCTVTLTEPMRVSLRCTVEVDGDALVGTARAGFFGTFALTGVRTSH